MSIIRFYRVAISPWTSPSCRFEPSCSAYAYEAIERHGAIKGGWMGLRRILRCHPWGGSGLDPVPLSGSGDKPSLEGDAEQNTTDRGS